MFDFFSLLEIETNKLKEERERLLSEKRKELEDLETLQKLTEILGQKDEEFDNLKKMYEEKIKRKLRAFEEHARKKKLAQEVYGWGPEKNFAKRAIGI